MTAAPLSVGLASWLARSAEGIDLGTVPAAEILPRLAEAGLTRISVPEDMGGTGGDIVAAVEAVAAVAHDSLASAFVLWGHRCYTEFLIRSDNAELRAAQLPDLLAGRVAGASGLSNAMKALAGLEVMQIKARAEGDTLLVDGKLPWVTNLRREGFFVAAAADRAEGGPAVILSLSGDDPGLTRSDDLELMGMRSTDTAAITITGARIPRTRIIAEDAPVWLRGLRPAFVGLQCGMAIGLARRALTEAEACSGSGRAVLAGDFARLRADLAETVAALFAGLRDGRFVTHPAALFELRIRLAEIVATSIGLELQAGGGRCYLREPGRDFARRMREAAFIPVITPSIVQLRGVLAEARQAA